MSTPKSNKKILSQWSQCENCSATILSKDINNHVGYCPPHFDNIQHPFVQSGVLCGKLEIKLNEDIKNLCSRERDNLIFVSQHVMQLCSFYIGENVQVNIICQDNKTKDRNSFVRKVWPTNEKSLMSVLLTKNCFDQLNLTGSEYVKVQKLNVESIVTADLVELVLISEPQILEIKPELSNRLSKCYSGHYLTKGNIVFILFYGNSLKFEVKSIQCLRGTSTPVEAHLQNLHIGDGDRFHTQFYSINDKTKWKIFCNKELFHEQQTNQSRNKIVGLENELAEIQSIMQACFEPSQSPNLSSKSVLLHGNSGTGKTMFVENIAAQSDKYLTRLCADDLYSSSQNDAKTEDTIKEIFKEAQKNSPSILIIDEIDLLCPARTSRLSESDKRIVSTMLNCLDNLRQSCSQRVFILATTNKIDSIDMAFRRHGRLDKEIEIPTPSPKCRRLILKHFLHNFGINLSEGNLHDISMATHGFVGADLLSLCSQANLNCFKRGSKLIEFEDLKLALRKIRPSAMREVQIEIPNVKWADIGGQESLKLILRQAVEWPLKYPESFARLGISAPKGVLMFGPPGCSKTMIAKALANESGLNFLSIKGPELFSKWVGDSEKAIRDVFRKARQVAPSIVFFDEIDALGGERSSGSSASVQERVLAQLLTELDGVTPLGDVTILAATNRPDKIDKALLRPGRLDRIVHVPLPDEHTRREIFRIKLQKMPVTNDVVIDSLVEKTVGYSGAEVNAVCHEAAMMALEENIQADKVENRHFENALKLVTPRTSKSLLDLYENYMNSKYSPRA